MKTFCCFLIVITTILNGISQQNKFTLSAKVQDTPQNDKFVVNLPLSFRQNVGQWDKRILFQGSAVGWNASVNFLKNSLSFGFSREKINSLKSVENSSRTKIPDFEYLVWNLRFIGANENVTVDAFGKESSNVNYLLGKNPENHHRNVPDYRMLIYQNLYPGIDVKFYRSDKNLKYDFIVKRGASINEIKMACEGVLKISKKGSDKLEIHTAWGVLIEELPESYQIINGVKIQRNLKYNLLNDTVFGFVIDGEYNPAYDLIIDPVILEWSTYIEGTSGGTLPQGQQGYIGDIEVDAAGNVFGTGWYSGGCPVTPGAYSTTWGGVGMMFGSIGGDAFVFKMNPTGTALLYATYVGGINPEMGCGIKVSTTGEAFVVGFTNSPDFPVTAGAFQTNFVGGGFGAYNVGGDAFAIKLDNTGAILLYSTYLGGFGADDAYDVEINAAGEAYVMGISQGGFPTTVGAYDVSHNGGMDVFITKLNTTASSLIYSTYIGGTGWEYPGDMALTASGDIIVVGSAGAAGFPTTAGAYQTATGGVGKGFVTRLNAAGNALVYSTLMGGTVSAGGTFNGCNGVAINAAEEVFVIGMTNTTDLPVTAGAWDITFSGGTGDLFVTRFNSTCSALIYSTYLGGSLYDYQSRGGIKINAVNEAFITAYTESSDYPVTSCAYDTSFNGGGGDFVVTKLDSLGSNLIYSTFIGGGGMDYYWNRIELYGNSCEQEVIICGSSHSVNYPTTAGVFRPTTVNFGGDEPVVSKFKPKIFPGFTHTNPVCGTQVNFTDTTNQCGLWEPISTWYWDFDDGSSSTAQHPVHTFSASGTYNVKMVLSCPRDSIIIPVTITNTITAVVSASVSICSGTSTALSASGGNRYNWSPSTGLNNNTSSSVNASPSSPTNYTVVISNNGLCPDTAEVFVNVNALPTVSVNGSLSVCNGGSTPLTAMGASTYSWLPSTGLSSTTGSVVSAGPTSATSYTLVGTDANGCTDTTVFSINSNSPTVVLSGNSQICEGVAGLHTASGALTYTWEPNSGISSTTGSIVSVTPTVQTTYTVIGTDAGGCTNITMMTVSVTPAPVAIISDDDTICVGESSILTASGGNAYSWNNGSATSSITVSPVLSSIYSVTVSNGNCTDVEMVSVIVNDNPTIDAGADVTIANGTSTVLTGSGGGAYSWYPSSGLSCVTCQNPTASPGQTTKYYLLVTDANGCTAIDSVLVIVEIICNGEVFVPNAFSPNGDAQNEVLYVYGNCFKTFLFEVYDRWGNKVFETTNPAIGWDGVYKGKSMDAAVFVYKLSAITKSDQEFILKGNVSLVK